MITVFSCGPAGRVTVVDTAGDAFRHGPSAANRSPIVLVDRAVCTDAIPWLRPLLADADLQRQAKRLVDRRTPGISWSTPGVVTAALLQPEGAHVRLVTHGPHDLLLSPSEVVAILHAFDIAGEA
jgi:hypothetical protein